MTGLVAGVRTGAARHRMASVRVRWPADRSVAGGRAIRVAERVMTSWQWATDPWYRDERRAAVNPYTGRPLREWLRPIDPRPLRY